MGRYEFMAASGRCRRIPGSRAGILQVNYYGVVDAVALDRVRSSMMGVCGNAPALVVRTDTALMVMDDVPLIDSAPGVVVPPAALVVRKEMRDLWVEYARQLAGVGITRAVFLDSQLEQAHRWAERWAQRVAA